MDFINIEAKKDEIEEKNQFECTKSWHGNCFLLLA